MGQTIGSMLGGAIGNWAGKGVRALIGGRGDYHEEHAASGLEVNANSIVQPMTASQVPVFSTPEHLHGAVRVQHREYLADINTSVDSILYALRINPSSISTFPWLHSISKNFEQWMALGVVFEFVSTAGNAFSGGAANLGDVNMATLYDVAAEPLITKSQILNHFYSTSAPTSQNLMHAIECAPDDTPVCPRYITHPNANPVTQDRRLEDLGILYILTAGSQSVYTAGQIWVTYDIVLLKPRLGSIFGVSELPLYYTAIEICRISELAAARGTPLSQEQLTYLASKRGKREDEEIDLEENALTELKTQKTPPPTPEEKSPGLLSGWALP